MCVGCFICIDLVCVCWWPVQQASPCLGLNVGTKVRHFWAEFNKYVTGTSHYSVLYSFNKRKEEMKTERELDQRATHHWVEVNLMEIPFWPEPVRPYLLCTGSLCSLSAGPLCKRKRKTKRQREEVREQAPIFGWDYSFITRKETARKETDRTVNCSVISDLRYHHNCAKIIIIIT